MVDNVIIRYWHTLRYLKPTQFYRRLWFKATSPKPDISCSPAQRFRGPGWVDPALREQSLFGSSSFKFLNQAGELSELSWSGNQRSKLWRYNQHYFDDLNAHDSAKRVYWHTSLMRRWVSENPPAVGDGWEPYPVSLRIVNWIKWTYSGNNLPQPCSDSLAIQARWLCRRLEYHLLGNHLFANAKALIFAGTFFKGEEAGHWLRLGLEILRKQIPEQILNDGGQFERTPMYHALAVEDMLDLLNVLRQLILAPDEYSNALLKSIMEMQVVIQRRLPSMLRWMNVMRHPDGEIALFNDAAFGVAPSCDELLQYAARLGIKSCHLPDNELIALQQSGYVRLSNSEACVLFDAAPIGPDYLPGHAHADTLSLELSLFGQRVFVNSGTSEYGISPERHRQRSTAAHNTVEINNENSSEVWSGFRVARRAYPYNQQVKTMDRIQETSAWHSGYRRLSPPVSVGRRLVLAPGSFQIEDLIEGPFKTAVSRFHCHPAVTIKKLTSNHLHLILPGDRIVALTVVGNAVLSVQANTWHPRFGLAEENQCIVISMLDNNVVTRLEWSQP